MSSTNATYFHRTAEKHVVLCPSERTIKYDNLPFQQQFDRFARNSMKPEPKICHLLVEKKKFVRKPTRLSLNVPGHNRPTKQPRSRTQRFGAKRDRPAANFVNHGLDDFSRK